MIQLSRNYSLPEKQEDDLAIKIVGVGGAGSNALDRIVLDGMEHVDLIVANTDVQSLASSVATHKVQLGRAVTRGLGAGGDPELGLNAAHESAEEIREALTGARMVFICAGLGGGTGSGAAPCIAQMAREQGALVLVFATLPFAFEGKRRGRQAGEALRELQQIADAVVCFENDRMGDIVLPKAGIHQAFAVADITISQSVRAIVNVVRRPGLIRIGFDELLSALRSQNSRCLFGFGESDSDNRAHEALELALRNPLMDRGKMLAGAQHVLVQIAGGPGVTLTEVEIVMRELGRHVEDHTQILFGTAVDGRMGDRLSVTLISSIGASEPAQTAAPPPVKVAPPAPVAPPAAVAPPPVAPPPNEPPQTKVATPIATEAMSFAISDFEVPAESPRPEKRKEEKVATPIAKAAPPATPPPPREKKTVPGKESAAVPQSPPAAPDPEPRKEKLVQVRQEVLQFEPVTRGRFEKSEPTIVEGQDLDVPTYLRKNVRVK